MRGFLTPVTDWWFREESDLLTGEVTYVLQGKAAGAFQAPLGKVLRCHRGRVDVVRPGPCAACRPAVNASYVLEGPGISDGATPAMGEPFPCMSCGEMDGGPELDCARCRGLRKMIEESPYLVRSILEDMGYGPEDDE